MACANSAVVRSPRLCGARPARPSVASPTGAAQGAAILATAVSGARRSAAAPTGAGFGASATVAAVQARRASNRRRPSIGQACRTNRRSALKSAQKSRKDKTGGKGAHEKAVLRCARCASTTSTRGRPWLSRNGAQLRRHNWSKQTNNIAMLLSFFFLMFLPLRGAQTSMSNTVARMREHKSNGPPGSSSASAVYHVCVING